MRRAEAVSVSTLDLDALQRVLAEAPVSIAILYGSHARDAANARSDVDVAVGFDESLSSLERTRARLDLIDRLGCVLESDAVDVVPLSGASDTLLREIRTDGILLRGSAEDLAEYRGTRPPAETHQERMATFDEHLSALERLV